MSDTAARVLTIIGLVFNGFAVAISGIFLFVLVFIIGSFSWIPFTEWLFWDLLIFSIGYFLLSLVTGLIVPGIAYGKINPDSKTKAAVMLIICGIIGILFVSLIGGILLLVGGIVVAAWKPYEDEVYRPYPAKPPVHYPPSTTPEPRPVTVQPTTSGARVLPSTSPKAMTKTPEPSTPEEKGFCTYCGSKLLGGEKFCPACGASLD